MSFGTVISASRRTDIPAFYMPWFMNCLENGSVDVKNPFNGVISRIDLRPENVHSIVFWSKNYGPFLDGCYAEKIAAQGYRMFFQFTLNTPSEIFEPYIPSFELRVAQMRQLIKIFGADSVEWRFDPVCFYRELLSEQIKNNLPGFETAVRLMAEAGIRKCVTSFLDIYPKLKKREKSAMIVFVEPDESTRVETLEWMAAVLAKNGMGIRLCCERELVRNNPHLAGFLSSGGCIDFSLLKKIHGGDASSRQDKGQRISQGCTCTESRDVGSYRLQPCFHNCLYCYAS